MRIKAATIPATVVVGTLGILGIGTPPSNAALLVGNSGSNNI